MVGPQQHEDRDPGRELLHGLRGRLPRKIAPEEAVRAVMCTFSQHVSGIEARRVLDALPTTLHPLLERCMLHRREEAESFGRDQLIVRVAAHLGVSLDEAERITSVVLQAIRERLPRKEAREVAHDLPLELRELWVDEQLVEPHPMFLAIEQRVELPRAVNGQRAMMYVMCNFMRRLSKGEARQLVGALPHEVRPLLEPCATARAEQAEHITRRDLLDHIEKDLHVRDAEPIVRTVFDVAQRFLPVEVIEHVKAQLPTDLKELWSVTGRDMA